MGDVINLQQYIKDNGIVTQSDVKTATKWAVTIGLLDQVDHEGKSALKLTELGGKTVVQFIKDFHGFIVSKYPEEHKFPNETVAKYHFMMFAKEVLAMYTHPTILIVEMLSTKLMNGDGSFSPEQYQATLDRLAAKQPH